MSRKSVKAGLATMGFVAKVPIAKPRAVVAKAKIRRDPKLDEARAIAMKNLAEISEEEDAAITADALADQDNLPADDLIRRRGRPPLAFVKRAVKLRIDPDVIDHFKAGGEGWQTRINDALRKAAKLD